MADTRRLFKDIGLPLVRILLRLTPQGVMVDIGDDFSRLTRGVGDYLASRRTERALLDIGDVATEKLDRFLQVEFPTVDPGDLNSAIAAVGEVLSKVGADTQLLIEKQLDPTKLSQHMMKVAGREQRASLYSEPAERIFDLLLEETCNYLVEIATTQPDFTVQGIAAMLQRGQSMSEKIEEILSRLPAHSHDTDRDARAAAFETRYRRSVALRFDRLDVFGADLERVTRRYRLSTAYVTLRSHASLAGDDSGELPTGKEVESVLSELGPRIVVRGEAGCGKTTLLQWAAVSAARREFPSQLDQWNRLIPFVVRLRRYTKRSLPATEELIGDVGAPLAALQPETWCTDTLAAGRGLVLIDGLDEVPDKQRPYVHQWLEGLIGSFPESYYVLTSRPSTLRSSPSVLEDFKWAWLLPMEPPEIKVFVRSWHQAVAENPGVAEEAPELDDLGEQLIGKVLSSRPLRTLASSPLLCAVTCALHYARRGSLPRRRVKLYEAALEMLLGRRDEARGVSSGTIGPDEKQEVLEDLAEWLVVNGESEAPKAQVLRRIRNTLRAMPHISLSETPDPLLT